MNYSTHHSSMLSQPTWTVDDLQEPVPFEDFKFSFGLDPEFSMPLPLDDLPNQGGLFDFLSDERNHVVEPPSLLDENDQKEFSQFLDTFFMDPSLDTNDTHHDFLLGARPPLPIEDELEEKRRNSILQSLDQQKQKLHNRLNYLSVNHPAPSPLPPTSPMSTSSRKRSIGSLSPTPSGKRVRHQKELLTEDEKRANHIASEQKRRNTIRNGFKDLTEIIPTLKNINNSKSTILFKAVDFIKYLDKRNRTLKEKMRQLELRLEVQGLHAATPSRPRPRPSAKPSAMHVSHKKQTSTSHPISRSPSSAYSTSSSTSLSTASTASLPSLPTGASAALLAHKTQQQQLVQLQEQLQLHQRLLAQQHEMKERALQQQHSVTLPPIDRSSPSSTPSKQGFRALNKTEPTISA
ncbi:hypothetical protein DM01DRAFT_1303617 [Hesseltinella vesiculosa]|uniref:BHLH domain-containing protein n=1 Tax=Hesseltinella vesiculosa TaxID=101127 RepID=A0A1X2GKZ5_9FUNG|nr:hypothetical protein DM01DRAFT_1303617 [Hesseltinella vesiculosa]